MREFKGTAVAALLLLVVTSVSGSQLVREFRGNNNSTTPEFTVEAPWILDWRLDADYDQLVALDVTLIEAKTGRHIGQVLHTKRRGNGVRLFEESGHYRLRVTASLAKWQIKVQEISREDAKLYTPSGN